MLALINLCVVLLCCLVGGYEIARFTEEHAISIPVQLDSPQSETVFASVKLDIYGSDIREVTISFCTEHKVTVAYCDVLFNHLITVVEEERRLYGPPRPAHSKFRHESAISSESIRFTNPELFRDFTGIVNRENEIVEILKAKWSERSMQRVTFLHSCQLSDAKDTRVLQHLLHLIQDSGLLEQMDAVVVLNYGVPVDSSVMNKFSDKIEWIQAYHDVRYFEVPTLRIMHTLVKHLRYIQRDLDPQVLYLHTKGVSYKELSINVLNWIEVMMYFLVERHASCIHLLQSGEIDTVGLLYRNSPQHYFCGNFWWATGSYLSTRPELRYEESVKYEAEYWLLRASQARIFVPHNNVIDHYTVPYPRSCYEGKVRNTSAACGNKGSFGKYIELSET